MKIYVASSWRNAYQAGVVRLLRGEGYEVYDFLHPHGGEGFQWTKLDANWRCWSMEKFRMYLGCDYARFGFNRDFNAMKEADVCVLVLPCGRSAHAEAGWMSGAGKKVIAYIPSGETIEPELMYNMFDGIAIGFEEVLEMLRMCKNI